jgi:hypothetical protein
MFARKHCKIAVALTCADWRLHQHKVDLNRRLARSIGVDGVDLIAVPGPDGMLLPERKAEWDAATAQIRLLIGAHNPVKLVVLAHQRCAGHPVSDEGHDTDVAAAAKALKAATQFPGPVAAMVAVYHADLKWGLKRIGTV